MLFLIYSTIIFLVFLLIIYLRKMNEVIKIINSNIRNLNFTEDPLKNYIIDIIIFLLIIALLVLYTINFITNAGFLL